MADQYYDDEALLAAEHALETEAHEEGRARYRALFDKRGLVHSAPGADLMRQSIGAVIAGIEEWQAAAADGTPGRLVGLAKFIAQYDSDEVAFVALVRVVRALHEPQKLTTVALGIARDLEVIDLESRLKRADPKLYSRYVRAIARRRDRKRLSILKQNGEYVGVFSHKAGFAWSDSERLQVGARLLEIVRETTGIYDLVFAKDLGDSGTTERPAYHIVATEQTAEWIEAANATMELSRPVFYPMVVPPLDWTDTGAGGYLTRDRRFARSLVKARHGNFKAEVSSGSIPLVTKAVNALQQVRFAVNTRVLDVVEKTLGDGSGTGLPWAAAMLPLPPRHDFMDLPSASWTPEQNGMFKAWKRETSEAKGSNNIAAAKGQYTRRLASIARKMAAFPALYFPHTLDFRGRAYPIPQYLQPQGTDLAKGLLQFADAAPLGTNGQFWLAVHLANTYGEADKSPFTERVEWVRKNAADIILDGRDPHRPHALWPKADDPFQFLAACFEWAALSSHVASGGDPEKFESRLPIGLDGSCNGLQHFSAMLRDEAGGRAVNLVPQDRPADIYAAVAEEVRKQLELDLTNDDPGTRKAAAFWLKKGITRKWTKRNTMTLVYGVTKRGMKDQLWAEIGHGNTKAFFNDTERIEYGFSVHYLADTNYAAIGKVVVAAREAMDWLQAVAGALSKAKSPIMWTTPDGLPVLQRYCKRDEVRVSIFGKDSRLQLTMRPYTQDLDAKKQVGALVPNFVHSVDAAHMRAVVRRLSDAGVTSMAMVHDSFAVHAGNVDTLSTIIREEFAAMHAEPLLTRFFEGVEPALPPGHDVPPVPAAGALDLASVLDADYFFA